MGRVLQFMELVEERDRLRKAGKKVVFTNGCFDIIHRGHIDYLLRARALGDALIVGINADASVRRLKGENRPVVRGTDRAFIVANLVPVDFVCLFDQDTPLELIHAVVPDVLVKGGDWKIDEIVGKDVVEAAGGTVATIEFTPNHSTSDIIQRVLQLFR
jgi:D-beta-D-heptose 7-phosphate kinase/D-beta-D-heptose 1-phosphate adenosyltransferase